MAEGRSEDFKRGLGPASDGTDRRALEANGIRKKAREEKLALIRHARTGTASLNGFHKASFLQEGHMGSLVALQDFLRNATPDQLDAQFEALFEEPSLGKAPGIKCLVFLAQGGSDEAERVKRSVACLLNLTGTRTSHLVRVAHAVISLGFLDTAARHILQQTTMAPDMWGVIANLSYMCPESRDAVMESAIITRPAGYTNWTSPLISELDRQTPELRATLILLLAGLFGSNTTLPNAGFIMCVWPYIINYLAVTVFPEPMSTLNEPLPEVDSLLHIFQSLGQFSPINQEWDAIFARLLGICGPSFLPFMVRMLRRTRDTNKRYIARFLWRIGMICKVPGEIFQRQMADNGGLATMMSLVQSSNDLLRSEGLKWLANYASDHLDFTMNLMDDKAYAIRAVEAIIRRGTAKLIPDAIYVYVAMCRACIRDTSDRETANGIMGALVGQFGVIELTNSHVCRTASISLILDILELWKYLLKWNWTAVLDIMEECGAMDKVAEMVAHQDTRIFELAKAIEDIRPLDYEVIPNVAWSGQAGMVGDGIFRGSFK